MARIDVQKAPIVFQFTGSLAANGSASGGDFCQGYARLVGGLFTDASSAAAGFRVEQSITGASTNLDVVSASNAIAACGVSTCSTTIVGNYIRVKITNGATSTASNVRALFYLLPI